MLEVVEAVLPIKSVYFALGQSLRLQAADLRSIKEKYPNESDDREALSDILELWLQKKYKFEKFGTPTWRMLVEAVDRKAGGNNHDLAKEIASDHPAAGIMNNSNFIVYLSHNYVRCIYSIHIRSHEYIRSILYRLLNPILIHAGVDTDGAGATQPPQPSKKKAKTKDGE